MNLLRALQTFMLLHSNFGCSGTLAVLEVLRTGFPVRLPFLELLNRCRRLLPPQLLDNGASPRDVCDALLRTLRVPRGTWDVACLSATQLRVSRCIRRSLLHHGRGAVASCSLCFDCVSVDSFRLGVTRVFFRRECLDTLDRLLVLPGSDALPQENLNSSHFQDTALNVLRQWSSMRRSRLLWRLRVVVRLRLAFKRQRGKRS